MSELIDRNVLKAKMYQEAFESDTDMQKWDSGCWIRYKLFEKVVDSTPTVPYGPRWHRVEDELPKEKNWVLVWHTGYATPKKAKFIVDVIPEFLLDGGGGAWELDGWSDNKGKVTHWMPLPEPPKEDA